MTTIVHFEAKSIQSYLLASSKLKDMIGASEQVENLCAPGGLLTEVLDVLKVSPSFARRNGGKFTAIFDQDVDADMFYSIWSYCVQQQAPGLSFIQNKKACVSEQDLKQALAEQQRELEISRNRLYPQLPVAGPLIARSRRTGAAAVAHQHEETLDSETLAKRNFQATLLRKKIDPEDQFNWPSDFEQDDPASLDAFPLLRNNPYIAIIHADGNGLGKILKKLIDELPSETLQQNLLDFSNALEQANVAATRKAINSILTKHAVQSGTLMPARPLVVGGDDWSFVVRGDLAIEFTLCYLRAFENETRAAFSRLQKDNAGIEFPERLTACAGIAFVKPKQPFYQAYALAESLCSHAKKGARAKVLDPTPSALAFHRITTSQIDHFEKIVDRELTTNDHIQLSLQPYFIDDSLSPCITDLLHLVQTLDDQRVSRGPLRKLLDLIYHSMDQAEQHYRRLRENLRRDAPGRRLETEIMETLEKLIDGYEHPQLPGLLKMDGASSRLFRTPLGDAITLISIYKGRDHG